MIFSSPTIYYLVLALVYLKRTLVQTLLIVVLVASGNSKFLSLFMLVANCLKNP